jgi:hypothetical protein
LGQGGFERRREEGREGRGGRMCVSKRMSMQWIVERR